MHRLMGKLKHPSDPNEPKKESEFDEKDDSLTNNLTNEFDPEDEDKVGTVPPPPPLEDLKGPEDARKGKGKEDDNLTEDEGLDSYAKNIELIEEALLGINDDLDQREASRAGLFYPGVRMRLRPEYDDQEPRIPYWPSNITEDGRIPKYRFIMMKPEKD